MREQIYAAMLEVTNTLPQLMEMASKAGSLAYNGIAQTLRVASNPLTLKLAAISAIVYSLARVSHLMTIDPDAPKNLPMTQIRHDLPNRGSLLRQALAWSALNASKFGAEYHIRKNELIPGTDQPLETFFTPQALGHAAIIKAKNGERFALFNKSNDVFRRLAHIDQTSEADNKLSNRQFALREKVVMVSLGDSYNWREKFEHAIETIYNHCEVERMARTLIVTGKARDKSGRFVEYGTTNILARIIENDGKYQIHIFYDPDTSYNLSLIHI